MLEETSQPDYYRDCTSSISNTSSWAQSTYRKWTGFKFSNGRERLKSRVGNWEYNMVKSEWNLRLNQIGGKWHLYNI